MAPGQVPDTFVAKNTGRSRCCRLPLTYMNLSGDAAAALLRITIPRGFADRRRRHRSSVRPAARAAGRFGRNPQRSQVGSGPAGHRVSPAACRGRARRCEARGSRALEVRARRREQLESVITRAADAAEMFAAEGIIKVMNTHNADDAESADN